MQTRAEIQSDLEKFYELRRLFLSPNFPGEFTSDDGGYYTLERVEAAIRLYEGKLAAFKTPSTSSVPQQTPRRDRYLELIDEMDDNPSENRLRTLADDFRKMPPSYSDALKMADECERRYNGAKNKREKEEKKQAQEALQETARRKARRIKKNIFLTIGTFITFGIIGIYLYTLYGTDVFRTTHASIVEPLIEYKSMILGIPGIDFNFKSLFIQLHSAYLYFAVIPLAIGIVSFIFFDWQNKGKCIIIALLMAVVQTITFTVWTVQIASPRVIDFGGAYGLEVVIFFVLMLLINLILILPGVIFGQLGFKHKVF